MKATTPSRWVQMLPVSVWILAANHSLVFTLAAANHLKMEAKHSLKLGSGGRWPFFRKSLSCSSMRSLVIVLTTNWHW